MSSLKFSIRVCIFLLAMNMMSLAQMPTPPDIEIELVPFTPANLHTPRFSVSASYIEGKVVYRYELSNESSSTQSIDGFILCANPNPEKVFSPTGWTEISGGSLHASFQTPNYQWSCGRVENVLAPGDSLAGFVIESGSLPGLSDVYVTGEVPPLRLGQNYENPEAVLPLEQNNVHLRTLAPKIDTSVIEEPSDLFEQLNPHIQEAKSTGLLPSSGALSDELNAFLSSLQAGDEGGTTGKARFLIENIESGTLTDEGRALLRPTLRWVLERWGTSMELVLKTNRDSTLRAHKPHRNEGANPRLFLSHRLEARNKSQNPLVGFDLSEADLNGLSKATLVMNVQDCDLPRRWGKNGRFIEAHALTASWVEGNGNKHRVNGGNGKTKGEGQGVTWFSPADDQIRNNRPDGSQQWMGGRSITAPLTAPAVQVLNRQTGPIEFDVTQDVLQAASLGSSSPEISWLLKKQDESKFGNIRFYSKEGAAQAGDETLAPTLILEYGGQTAQSSEPGMTRLLSKLGFGATQAQIELSSDHSEVPSLREQLKESPVAGFMGEALVSTATGANPVVNLAAQTAYRAWVS